MGSIRIRDEADNTRPSFGSNPSDTVSVPLAANGGNAIDTTAKFESENGSERGTRAHIKFADQSNGKELQVRQHTGSAEHVRRDPSLQATATESHHLPRPPNAICGTARS